MKPGVNLWSRVLIHNHPTRERDSIEDMLAFNFFMLFVRRKEGYPTCHNGVAASRDRMMAVCSLPVRISVIVAGGMLP